MANATTTCTTNAIGKRKRDKARGREQPIVRRQHQTTHLPGAKSRKSSQASHVPRATSSRITSRHANSSQTTHVPGAAVT